MGAHVPTVVVVAEVVVVVVLLGPVVVGVVATVVVVVLRIGIGSVGIVIVGIGTWAICTRVSAIRLRLAGAVAANREARACGRRKNDEGQEETEERPHDETPYATAKAPSAPARALGNTLVVVRFTAPLPGGRASGAPRLGYLQRALPRDAWNAQA